MNKEKIANQAYTPFLNDGAMSSKQIADFIKGKSVDKMAQISNINLAVYEGLKAKGKPNLKQARQIAENIADFVDKIQNKGGVND